MRNVKTPVLETTTTREGEFAEFLALIGERARGPEQAELDAASMWGGILESEEVKS